MLRYHKQLGIPSKYHAQMEELNNKFNSLKRFGKTNHAMENIHKRFEYMKILQYLANDIEFKTDYIFEIYSDNDIIKKMVYRLPFSNYQDLIIVLTCRKDIVTLYLNNREDNHKTLRKEQYNTI